MKYTLSKTEFDRLMFKHIQEGMTKEQAYEAVIKLTKVIKENHKKIQESDKKTNFVEKFRELKGK